MRPGFGQFQVASEEYLLFAQQFGATDILLIHPLFLVMAANGIYLI